MTNIVRFYDNSGPYPLPYSSGGAAAENELATIPKKERDSVKAFQKNADKNIYLEIDARLPFLFAMRGTATA
jgi:hypothetical protein